MQLLQTHITLSALIIGATGVYGLKCYVGGGVSVGYNADLSVSKDCESSKTKCKNETKCKYYILC